MSTHLGRGQSGRTTMSVHRSGRAGGCDPIRNTSMTKHRPTRAWSPPRPDLLEALEECLSHHMVQYTVVTWTEPAQDLEAIAAIAKAKGG